MKKEGRMRDRGREDLTQVRSHGIRRPVSSQAGCPHPTICTSGERVQIPMGPMATVVLSEEELARPGVVSP